MGRRAERPAWSPSLSPASHRPRCGQRPKAHARHPPAAGPSLSRVTVPCCSLVQLLRSESTRGERAPRPARGDGTSTRKVPRPVPFLLSAAASELRAMLLLQAGCDGRVGDRGPPPAPCPCTGARLPFRSGETGPALSAGRTLSPPTGCVSSLPSKAWG